MVHQGIMTRLCHLQLQHELDLGCSLFRFLHQIQSRGNSGKSLQITRKISTINKYYHINHISKPRCKKILDVCTLDLPNLLTSSDNLEKRWYGPVPPKVFHHHNDHQHDIDHNHQHIQEHSHKVSISKMSVV